MTQGRISAPVAKVSSPIKWKSVIGAILAPVVFAVIWFTPLAGVTRLGQGFLAALAAAIVLWVTETLPVAFTAFLLISFCWVFGYATPAVALGGFANPTWWLLFAALGLSTCVTVSGFAKRLALSMMAAIGRPTYKRVLAMAFAVVFVLGYVLPSSGARTAAAMALLVGLVPLFGAGIQSNIGMIFYMMIPFLGYAGGTQVLTGGTPSVITAGILDKSGAGLSWISWAVLAFFPTVLVFVILYFVALRYAKPEANEAMGGREKIQADLKALGPMKFKEMWGALVTLGIIGFWIADQWLKIGTAQIAVIGIMFYMLPGIGVITFGDFIKKTSWEILLLAGCVIGLGGVISAVGVGPAIMNALTPITNLATNPLTLVISVFLLSLVVFGASLTTATLPLAIPVVAKAAGAVGVYGAVAGVMYVSFAHLFFVWVGGAVIFIAFATKDGAVKLKDWVKMAFIYSATWFVAWVVSMYTWVPLLTAIGLLPK